MDTARVFFGVNFEELSEADLVGDDGIRSSIRSAESSLSTDEPTKALEFCRNALDSVEALMKSVIVISEDDHFGPPVPNEWRAAAAGLVNWTARRFAALEKSVALSILNVNPADYWFLYNSLPQKTLGATFYWPPRSSPIPIQTAARARTCIRIITNVALRVERARDDLNRIAVQSGVAEEQRCLRELKDRLLNTPIAEPSQPPDTPP